MEVHTQLYLDSFNSPTNMTYHTPNSFQQLSQKWGCVLDSCDMSFTAFFSEEVDLVRVWIRFFWLKQNFCHIKDYCWGYLKCNSSAWIFSYCLKSRFEFIDHISSLIYLVCLSKVSDLASIHILFTHSKVLDPVTSFSKSFFFISLPHCQLFIC